MTAQLCFEYREGEHHTMAHVQLIQTGFDEFTVRYGKQIESELDYHAACKALGAALMHLAACDGRLDSRDESEIENDDTEPYFSRPVPARD